ncbi:MAG: PHB depolymerase family esterase [Polyangiaceae bacterium]
MSRGGILLGLAIAVAPSIALAEDGDHPWCAPELSTLSNSVCTYTPEKIAEGPKTLVIFLHGLTSAGSDWQYAFQRAGMRIADSKGFTVIMPRGRLGIGPGNAMDTWAWPTAQGNQATTESELLEEWATAQSELEAKAGSKFERVWVFGFSNGAYYAASLAARGRLASDGDSKHPVASGYAVFAGGSGASYLSVTAKNVEDRPRFFVAWGGQDPAHGDQEELAHMLHDLGWPLKTSPAPKAGHTATDKQLTEAVAFLGGETDPDKTVPKITAKPQRTSKSKTAKKSKSKSKSKKKSKKAKG